MFLAILVLLPVFFLKIDLIPINSYFLVRKNVEKWGYIEMGFGSDLGVRFGNQIRTDVLDDPIFHYFTGV